MLTREGIIFIFRKLILSHWILVGLLYLISPIDLIPECIFGIVGLIDDLIVLGIMLLFISNIFYNFLANRDN